MKKISFTICSSNYLAQAITLCNSLKIHAVKHDIFIVLCDTLCVDITCKIPSYITVIPVQELGIFSLESMVENYGIIELNTSIKASAFKLFYNKYNAEMVLYFDPDIMLFSDIVEIEKELEGYNILLTPHILSPPPNDDLTPQEPLFQRYGLYNLGFLATIKNEETHKMLDWWEANLLVNCYNRPEIGIFVDQLPMNFVPIYFKGVCVSENFGFNVAPWNCHERVLSYKNDTFLVNDKTPLTFYHFSSFKIDIVKQDPLLGYTRFTFNENGPLIKLYELYQNKLLSNGYTYFSGLIPQVLQKKYTADPLCETHSLFTKFKKIIRKILTKLVG